MKVAFKADSPALLKIAEIGEFLAETNDLLRRNLVFSVLAAVRDGEIPLRNKAGLKVSSDALRDTKRKARLVAKQKAESRARKPCLLDFRLADLRDEKRRYLASEGPVLSITHGIRIPEYDKNIFDLTREKQLLVEWEREQRDLDKTIQLNNFNRRGYVCRSDLAGWLRDDQGFDVTFVQSDISTDQQPPSVSNAAIVKYEDLLVICSVDDENDFYGYLVKPNGLYVKEYDKHAWNPLTPSEKAAVRAWHPTGEYDKPARPLPCTLGELRTFVAEAGLSGSIDENVATESLRERAQTAGTPPQVGAESPEPAKTAHSGATEDTALPATSADDTEQADNLVVSETVSRPLLQQPFQEKEILRVILELGHTATKLPRRTPGKPWIKTDVRKNLPFSEVVFNKAWDRLRKDGRIK
ncbi:MAG: hypothetical protein J5W83_17380 [Candidatus Accumulibacter sp.]|uniref:hypothetical protein n=1 Tax=Accumulibacter sp. TaxID=2053492 RepID=UPI001B1A2A7B|nr:hypothetical protein [Accumulibacter sp.]MBO3704282.1 hypothetical protein [Accumulibacter sp.]